MKSLSPIIWFVLSGLACVVAARASAGFVFAPLDQQPVAEAKIHVAELILHIRYDSQKEDVALQMPIQNRGQKRLIVRTREADCNCFASAASVVVPPGETKNLPLPLAMQSLANRTQIDLVLVTNDPQQSIVPFKILIKDSLTKTPADAVSVLVEPLDE